MDDVFEEARLSDALLRQYLENSEDEARKVIVPLCEQIVEQWKNERK